MPRPFAASIERRGEAIDRGRDRWRKPPSEMWAPRLEFTNGHFAFRRIVDPRSRSASITCCRRSPRGCNSIGRSPKTQQTSLQRKGNINLNGTNDRYAKCRKWKLKLISYRRSSLSFTRCTSRYVLSWSRCRSSTSSSSRFPCAREMSEWIYGKKRSKQTQSKKELYATGINVNVEQIKVKWTEIIVCPPRSSSEWNRNSEKKLRLFAR